MIFLLVLVGLPILAASPATAQEDASQSPAQATAASSETIEPSEETGTPATSRSPQTANSKGWQERVDKFFKAYLVTPLDTVLFFDFGTEQWLGTSVPLVVFWLL